MKLVGLVFFLLVAVHLHSAAATCSGKPNLQPISIDSPKLVRSTTNGKLYTAGTGEDQIHVVHVYGDPYDWGYAQGQLLRREINYVMPAFFKHLEDTLEQQIPYLPQSVKEILAEYGLDGALDLTYFLTEPYTPKAFYEELRGLANGTGLDYSLLLRIHMLPELVKAACSMFGSWGKSTPKGELYQLRALDWDTSGPLQTYPTVTVYHPKPGNGHPFANVGWAGWIGVLTGMSSAPIGISEKVGDDFGETSRAGIPWYLLLKDILQYDNTLDDAINRMINAHRTCNIWVGVGDGNQRQFRLFEYGWEELIIFNPLNTPFTPRLPDVVYRGVNQDCFAEQLQYWSNKQNLTAVNTIRDVVSISQTGDLHIAVYDFDNQYMYVANAKSPTESGPDNAYDRSFVRLEMKQLWRT